MMTINKAIADAKQLRPTSVTFSDERIAGWVWELEQKIVDEVVEGEPIAEFDDVENWDEPLTATGIHERIYPLYTIAQADFFMQEYEAYNNSANAFNSAFSDFKKWYIRKFGTMREHYWKGLM